jgi:BirA family transcriptional regulator, biotin operon repressor / biotin---[acetyl-CoA-carboxylase] ligase
MSSVSDERPPDDLAAVFDTSGSDAAAPRHLRYAASVTSTMDVAAAALQASAPEGFTVVANEQTAGRGRRGRAWQSPPGAGLYFSIVFRPPLDATDVRVLSLITLAAGLGVRAGIAQVTGLVTDLKWPNDVLIGRRKIAGILAEGHNLGGDAQAVVIGVGVNVRQSALDAGTADRATSLEAELGRAVTRGPLLDALLVAVPAAYRRLVRGEADAILREWRAAAPSALGSRVEWDTSHGVERGTTAGVDDHGALLIQTRAAMERFVGGELRWM